VQSGSELRIGNAEDSKAFGLAFIRELGITPEEANSLNDFTYGELVAASQRTAAAMSESGSTLYHSGAGPVVDGKYIVQHPFDPAPAEFSKDVPMLIGSNLNEWSYPNRAIVTPLTMEEVRATLAENYGTENVEKYIEAYRETYPEDDQPQHILTTTFSYRLNALKQAELKNAQDGAPVFVYQFVWQSPINDGSLGACHGMELPFMFNNIAMARTMTGGGEDAYKLADKISSAWISFIKTGDPNSEALPEWDPYTSENGSTMIFDNNCEIMYNHDKALVNLLLSIPYNPMR
jgi:para-nitrobenzyl esterase